MTQTLEFCLSPNNGLDVPSSLRFWTCSSSVVSCLLSSNYLHIETTLCLFFIMQEHSIAFATLIINGVATILVPDPTRRPIILKPNDPIQRLQHRFMRYGLIRTQKHLIPERVLGLGLVNVGLDSVACVGDSRTEDIDDLSCKQSKHGLVFGSLGWFNTALDDDVELSCWALLWDITVLIGIYWLTIEFSVLGHLHVCFLPGCHTLLLVIEV